MWPVREEHLFCWTAEQIVALAAAEPAETARLLRDADRSVRRRQAVGMVLAPGAPAPVPDRPGEPSCAWCGYSNPEQLRYDGIDDSYADAVTAYERWRVADTGRPLNLADWRWLASQHYAPEPPAREWSCTGERACQARKDARQPAPLSAVQVAEDQRYLMALAREVDAALGDVGELALTAPAPAPPASRTAVVVPDPWGHVLGAQRGHTLGAQRAYFGLAGQGKPEPPPQPPRDQDHKPPERGRVRARAGKKRPRKWRTEPREL
jgi:hypothetical protein